MATTTTSCVVREPNVQTATPWKFPANSVEFIERLSWGDVVLHGRTGTINLSQGQTIVATAIAKQSSYTHATYPSLELVGVSQLGWVAVKSKEIIYYLYVKDLAYGPA